MAAFPTTRKHVHLPGQGSVEFILVMPVLLTFLFAIGSFAMLSYQNTVIQHSLATLPAGWQQQDRNELVRDLVCGGTDLDKSRLTVTNASVKTETSGAVNDGDSIASDLGASTLRTETRRVAVEADIAYEYNDPLSLGRKTVLTRHVSHSYTTYTDWEVL